MNPRQRERLAEIRADLERVAAEMQADRDAAPHGEKPAIRYPLRHIEHGLAQLRLAERDADRRGGA